MIAAKQNQKFPFHFLSAPPTPPAEENKKGKENFWFLLPRPKGADEARNRSVRFSSELPRAPRVRSGFAQRLIFLVRAVGLEPTATEV